MFLLKVLLFVLYLFVNIPVAYSVTPADSFSDKIPCPWRDTHSRSNTLAELSRISGTYPIDDSPHLPFVSPPKPFVYKVEAVSSVNQPVRIQIREMTLEEQDALIFHHFSRECLLNLMSFLEEEYFQKKQPTVKSSDLIREAAKISSTNAFLHTQDHNWRKLEFNDVPKITVIPFHRSGGDFIDFDDDDEPVTTPPIPLPFYIIAYNGGGIESYTGNDYFREADAIQAIRSSHSHIQGHYWRGLESNGVPKITVIPFHRSGGDFIDFDDDDEPVTTPPIPLPFYIIAYNGGGIESYTGNDYFREADAIQAIRSSPGYIQGHNWQESKMRILGFIDNDERGHVNSFMIIPSLRGYDEDQVVGIVFFATGHDSLTRQRVLRNSVDFNNSPLDRLRILRQIQKR